MLSCVEVLHEVRLTLNENENRLKRGSRLWQKHSMQTRETSRAPHGPEKNNYSMGLWTMMHGISATNQVTSSPKCISIALPRSGGYLSRPPRIPHIALPSASSAAPANIKWWTREVTEITCSKRWLVEFEHLASGPRPVLLVVCSEAKMGNSYTNIKPCPILEYYAMVAMKKIQQK